MQKTPECQTIDREMANPKPDTSHLIPYKPGQSGNPKGMPPRTATEMIIKKIAHDDIKEIIELISNDDLEGLKAIKKAINSKKKGPTGVKVIKALLASVAIKILEKGDMDALDKLLNRLVGKVKDQTEITGSNGLPFEVIVKDYRNETE